MKHKKDEVSEELLKEIAHALSKARAIARTAIRKTFEHGGSHAINLPALWLQDNGIEKGDKLDLFSSPTGSLIIRVHKRVQKVKRKVDT